MNRRLLDQFLLAECKLIRESLTIHKPIDGKVSAKFNVAMGFEVGTLDPPPGDAKQAIRASVSLDVSVVDKEDPPATFYEAAVQVAGLLLLPSGDPVDSDAIASDQHSIARMIFPICRSYLWQMLARARIPDLPMAWDLGPQAQKQTDVQGNAAPAAAPAAVAAPKE